MTLILKYTKKVISCVNLCRLSLLWYFFCFYIIEMQQILQLAMLVIVQIVSAIAYCHQLHVVHRDLKPENVVFFNKSETVKLTDFGFSNLFIPGHKLKTSCGSLAYSAPEILLGDSYDAPAVGMCVCFSN